MKDSASKVDFASFDDLFGKEGNAGQEKVLTVDLGALHTLFFVRIAVQKCTYA